jgi:hypothetical protein
LIVCQKLKSRNIGPQHEEMMIAGFSIGPCPLLGC